MPRSELEPYVRQKTVAFILIMMGLLIAGWFFNALTLLGVITLLVGTTSLIIAWMLERGIIKQSHVSGVILIGSGVVLLIVGLIFKGVIPILGVITGDVASDIVLSATIYVILVAIIIITVYTIYSYIKGRPLLSVGHAQSKYVE